MRSDKPLEEKNKVIKVLKGQLTLDFDNESAERASFIDGKLIKNGKTINPIDSMIAGIAIVNKQKILTKNVKDFIKIDNIEIEEY